MEKRRILLVDDERDFIDCLAKRLQRRGIDCLCAYNGAEAVSKISEGGFDLVVLDMLLPDTNGNEVLRFIKQATPDTPVIILTGHASAACGRDSLDLGAVEYLLKPIELESLYEKLCTLQPARESHNKGSPLAGA